MIKREITAYLPDGTVRVFSSAKEAARELHICHRTIESMLAYGKAYSPVPNNGNNGQKDLIGMTMAERVEYVRPKPVQPRMMCLSCVHIYPFHAKGGVRYVCCIKGKRIDEEPTGCRGFERGEGRRTV